MFVGMIPSLAFGSCTEPLNVTGDPSNPVWACPALTTRKLPKSFPVDSGALAGVKVVTCSPETIGVISQRYNPGVPSEAAKYTALLNPVRLKTLVKWPPPDGVTSLTGLLPS